MSALLLLRGLFTGTAARARIPRDLPARYPELYAAELVASPNGGRSFHRGRAFRRGGLHVLHLEGDRFEMAFQHGRLLRQEIADGSLQRAARIVPDAIRGNVGSGPLGRLLTLYATHGIAGAMLESGLAQTAARASISEQDALSEAYGLSEGSGVPVDTILQAALGPETAQTLLGKSAGLAVGGDPAQCTSFAAWGDATRDGALLIGRNTDYPLTGYYDRHPTVIYFHPTDDAQRYMAVTTAGFHNAGVCGMNEAGVYLAIHTVPASRVSESGLPVFMVGQLVLRTAKTFQEAQSILQDSKPAAGWTYHLVSTKERKVASFELSTDHVARVDPVGSSHITTNHWRHPEMEARNLFVSESVEDDTRARMRRVEALISESAGQLDAAGAAHILGDALDPTSGRARVFPNTVAASITVSSSVWSPDTQQLWVAAGRAPVSRTEYVELPTLEKFDPDRFDEETYGTLAPAQVSPQLAAAEEKLILAREALDYEDDADRALAYLEEAAAAFPEDPSITLILGMVALRAERRERAEAAFAQVASDDSDLRRRAIARYLHGRMLAHRGDKRAALECLALASHDPFAGEKLRTAAARSAAKLTKRSHLPLGARDVAPMFYMADAFRYDHALVRG